MEWKNYGLVDAKNLDAEHFTTEKGIKIRRKFFPLLKLLIEKNTGKKVYLIAYPKLERNESYIFAAGHSFPGEIATNLSVIDRSTYTLMGTTDQVDHNPQMYFLWITGLVFVSKLNTDSRKESFKKMKRVLENDSSVMLFPEGVLNNTENLNCTNLYPGVIHLSKETGKKIVPIVSHYDYENQVVYVAADNPINVDGKEKNVAKRELRDTLASLRFNLSRIKLNQAKELDHVLTPDEFYKLNPNLEIELKRSELNGDIHQQFMELRKKIYNEVRWHSSESFEEEIMNYKEKDVTTPEEAFMFIDNINLEDKSPETIEILAPILKRRIEQKKYNFKEYMKKNWNK